MWLCRHTTVDLLVGFRIDDLDSRAVSTRQRSHIKSLFVNMLHQIWNLRYSRHLRITNCVGLEPFILTINLDVMSSSNIFSMLVYVLKCNVLLF